MEQLAFIFLDFSEQFPRKLWLQTLEWVHSTEIWEITKLKLNNLLFSSLIFLNNFHGDFGLVGRDGFIQTRPAEERRSDKQTQAGRGDLLMPSHHFK